MKSFHCDHCQQLVFFENTQCIHCGHALAFLADLMDMGSLEPVDGNLWTSPAKGAEGRTYRLCENYLAEDVCNWAFPAEDPGATCRSCRLTRSHPDPTQPGQREAWYRLESAKRRLVYSLLQLHLPLISKEADPQQGLAFDFLAESPAQDTPVLTGHRDGVIVINVAEADDAERERRRLVMHEPYRTLLGHFRHEIAHYYWDRLIRDSDRIEAFRQTFGDERADYVAALQRHHQQGPPADWQQQFITAYASAHPWEDWAETWAHYLHITDTLETAAACGLSLQPRRADEPAFASVPVPADDGSSGLDSFIDSWFPLAYLLNNLNRGLGLPDGYQFVLSSLAINKLRFVQQTVARAVHATSAV